MGDTRWLCACGWGGLASALVPSPSWGLACPTCGDAGVLEVDWSAKAMGSSGTFMGCPHCQGPMTTAMGWCPRCRRSPLVSQLPLPHWCWEWHGPDDHYMRCRKVRGHAGEHDCKDWCHSYNPETPDGCRQPNGHDGPHDWVRALAALEGKP